MFQEEFKATDSRRRLEGVMHALAFHSIKNFHVPEKVPGSSQLKDYMDTLNKNPKVVNLVRHFVGESAHRVRQAILLIWGSSREEECRTSVESFAYAALCVLAHAGPKLVDETDEA